MKQFWKMVLAVIVGLLLMTVIMFMLLGSFIGAVAAAGSSEKPVLPREGVLAIDLSEFSLVEQTSNMPSDIMSIFNSGYLPEVGLYQAVSAIKAAASDPAVKFIYLKTDAANASTAGIEELRAALEDFRKSGKAVISYIENPTVGTYWLASVADKVLMSEYQGANSAMVGIGTQNIFVKDLLDKLGVNVQLIRHGKYKSAGEMYVRNSSSPENTEQYQVLVNSLWSTISADIAERREISVAQLDSMLENLTLCLPQDYLDNKMVDALLTREQLKEKLATYAVKDSFKDVKFMPFADYVLAKTPATTSSSSKPKIAVLYVDGNIVDGKANQNVAGDRFTSVIDKIRSDKNVKAVVLRVNSPGGSVLASEKIKHELDLLGEEKPMVASYGSYAASGGYWISNNCSKIYTDATTLTGSIGVFGMVPDFSKTTKNLLHVNVESVKTHKHADMYGLMRPFDQSEYNFMLHSIETIYDKFTTTVSEGRGIPKEDVDAIGQGRVWTGADALEIKLVDEIGTLEDAIAYATQLAGGSGYQVAEYPAPLTAMEEIMASFGKGNNGDYVLAKIASEAKPQILARMPFEVIFY